MNHSPVNHSPGQMPLPISVGDKATFDNFWVGRNTELLAAIRCSVESREPRLVYFYGPRSCGKSHLLFAAMKLAKQHALNTCYLSLSDKNVSPTLLGMMDAAQLVCIDNVHAWAGTPAREEALFTLIEQIRHINGQLLLSSARPPASSGFRLADLVSRLASGLVYPLSELDEEQQFEALKMRAKQRGLIISEDAIRYYLSRSSRNTGELFAFLDEIDRASLIHKRRITIPFLQTLMQR